MLLGVTPGGQFIRILHHIDRIDHDFETMSFVVDGYLRPTSGGLLCEKSLILSHILVTAVGRSARLGGVFCINCLVSAQLIPTVSKTSEELRAFVDRRCQACNDTVSRMCVLNAEMLW